jgi:hypothetical protein
VADVNGTLVGGARVGGVVSECTDRTLICVAKPSFNR